MYINDLMLNILKLERRQIGLLLYGGVILECIISSVSDVLANLFTYMNLSSDFWMLKFYCLSQGYIHIFAEDC